MTTFNKTPVVFAAMLTLAIPAFAGDRGAVSGHVWYVVEGLALGEGVHFGSRAYNAYNCVASDQFPGFTWCQRKDQKGRGKQEIFSSISILHGPDGTTTYINRSIAPAFLTEREAKSEIDRLSGKFAEKPRLLNMPDRRGLPRGLIATWGKVDLVPVVDRDAISALEAGESPRIGLLVDFLGDLHKSAKLDLPLYRVSGGPGYVWSTSFDQKGVGHLRFFAVDVSALSETRTEVAGPTERQDKEIAADQAEKLSPSEQAVSSGSGFAVSSDGLLLTNRHVVENCTGISVAGSGSATVRAVDEWNDLALLQINATTSPAQFRASSGSLGEAVYVLGYPLGGILGSGMNFTTGAISSLSGLRNDSRYLQFTAPIQPGNSGGPMVDVNGLIVGVVSAKLDDVEILKASGSFPQNVNFAIRGDLAQGFLRANGVDPILRDPSASTPWTISEVVKHSQAYTMHVICAGVAKTAAVQR